MLRRSVLLPLTDSWAQVRSSRRGEISPAAAGDHGRHLSCDLGGDQDSGGGGARTGIAKRASPRRAG